MGVVRLEKGIINLGQHIRTHNSTSTKSGPSLVHIVTFGLFREDFEVQVFEDGIQITKNEKSSEWNWKAIKQVRIFEWFDNRWSVLSFNINLITIDGKDIRFNSRKITNPELLIELLKSRVQEFSYIEWNS
jgi:hypothetical protein